MPARGPGSASPWLALLVSVLTAKVVAGAALSAGFEISSRGSAEVTESGHFCFDERGIWRMDTQVPHEQTLVSTDTITVILYPREKRAFRIRTGLLEPPSHLFFFAHSLATNEQLASMGLVMTDFEARGDTTVTTWRRAGGLAGENPGFVAVHRAGSAVVCFDLHHPDGNRSRYAIAQTVQVAGSALPGMVDVDRWEGGVLHEERIRYFDIMVDQPAEEVLNPEIPSDFTIEQRSW